MRKSPVLRRALSDEMRDMLATAAVISSTPSSTSGATAPADSHGFGDLLDLFSGRRTEYTAGPSLSLEEAATVQAEELEVLSSIFGPDELVVESESGCHLLRLTVRSLALETAMGGGGTGGGSPKLLSGSTARLTIVMPASYPAAAALLELDTLGNTRGCSGGSMRAPLLSATEEEALYDELLRVAVRCAAASEPAVYELSAIARDRLVDALAARERREAELSAVRQGLGGGGQTGKAGKADKDVGARDSKMHDGALLSQAARAVFSLLEAEAEPTEAERRAVELKAVEAYRGAGPSAEVVGAEAAAEAEALVWERAAAYYSRVQQGTGGMGSSGKPRDSFHPSKYVGSVRDLLTSLPTGMCVMSVENVVRPNLAERFEACHRRFEKKYGGDRQRCQPRRAFHGTAVANVGSIVSTGLIVPGQQGVRIVNGAACGHGIYLAENAGTSVSYCRGGGEDSGTMRMLVCAALLGSSKACGQTWAAEGHDSFFSGSVMVLGTAAQCLPCYVIHFRYNNAHSSDKVVVPGALMVTKGGLLMQAGAGTSAGTPYNGYGHKGGSGCGGAMAAAAAAAGAAEEENSKQAPLSASMQASIKNASFYLDTKKYKVLGCAEHDDDDDDFEGVEFGMWGGCEGMDEFSDVIGGHGGEYQQARRAPPPSWCTSSE